MTSRGGTRIRVTSEYSWAWEHPRRNHILATTFPDPSSIPKTQGPQRLEPRPSPYACDERGSREGEGDGTFLQSSHTTQAEPSIPSCSPHSMQQFTPSPATFFLMFSRRSTRRLEAESGLYGPHRTRDHQLLPHYLADGLNLL